MTGGSSLVTLGFMGVAFVSTFFVGPAATGILSGLLLTLAFIVWTQSAYLLFAWLLVRHRSHVRGTIAAIGSFIVVGWSAILLVDAFLLRPDPQSALILLFLPVPQWIGCAVTLLADAVAAHIEYRDQARTTWKVVKTRLLLLLFGVTVLLAGWWLLQRPSNQRPWVTNLAKLTRSTFDGDKVTIQDIRNTEYRSADDFTPAYYDRTFDLHRIESVDFVVVPFESLKVAAHTFVIFGFEGGERLAISVEVRLEQGESYSPLRGMLRQCELMYLIADERDVVLLRTMFRKERVFLYPIRAPRLKIRDMFVSMLRRANQLRTRPEFYNTLTNNCTSNILRHFNHVNQRKLPASLKILFPGYSDQLVYDLGMIDSPFSFDRLRSKSEITEKANRFANDEAFSRLIRE